MNLSYKRAFLAVALLGAMIAPPAAADEIEQEFDRVFGNGAKVAPAPAPLPAVPRGFEARLANIANASMGRIGVAAVDLGSGRGISVMGDQPFPMASTVKVAIVATFLEGVDQGRFHLSDRYPLMMPVPSRRFSTAVAPVRPGTMLSALELIELAITRSDNHATDALLAAIGGPQAVNRWLRKTGVSGIHIDRDIATLVRDDGAIDPARTIDLRDSTTPQAMATLLAGLYQGQWLTPQSREVLLGAMRRCLTGVHRMKALLPGEAMVGHKTGTLSNTSSDVGIIRTADGRTLAVAIYVTGQGSKPGREARIANIARAIYDGYQSEPLAALVPGGGMR
ncbi:MAG TPA: serine hydrolase [Novosphingobium sp.]|nr:serine hydrolase [Novosphingobium sp.]